MAISSDVKNTGKRTRYKAGIAAGADVALLKSGKVLIQCVIKVFPVAVPQCDAHIKANDAFYACFDAVREDSIEVFLGVIEKWQDRVEPENGGNPGFFQCSLLLCT